jgi:hypothetical protein
MHETPADLDTLQDLLDRSYAMGGAHLVDIHTPEARLTATDLVDRLQGMRVLVVATVSSAGRPYTGPVDGFLYRGRWCFGTSATAVRARHLRANPAISATYVEGEGLVVTVHGRARPLDLGGADAGFVEVLRAKYGGDWLDTGNPYYAIEADRMLAADMTVHTAPS